jgi:hypothetical protein
MTSPGNGCHVAQWSGGRNNLVITDPAGNVVDLQLTEPAGDRPPAQILWHTGWVAYPGTEWQEEPPGQWSRAVFPDTEMGCRR